MKVKYVMYNWTYIELLFFFRLFSNHVVICLKCSILKFCTETICVLLHLYANHNFSSFRSEVS